MLYGDFSGIELFKERKALYQALAFWRDKAGAMADGRVDLADGVYVSAKDYSPAPREERRYESHIQYADIQCVLKGEEMIYVRPVAGLKVQEDFLAERDVVFFGNPSDGVPEVACHMRPGNFLLLYPEDAHKPECRIEAASGRKIVFKIPMTLLQ